MLTTQKHARALLGNQLVLRIDPRRLEAQVDCKKPIARRLEVWMKPAPKLLRKGLTLPLRRHHPFAIGARWFPLTAPIESLPKFHKVHDLYHHRDDYRQSRWYAALREELETRGEARHKRIVMYSEADIIDFFERYVGDLVRSMTSRGYIDGLAEDIGTAMIGDDGTLYKGTSGTHRFYIARLVGSAPVPVRITCVHREWLRSEGLAPSAEGLTKLAPALREIERRYA